MVEDGAFLADDTMVASYELGGGWIHVAKATIGKRAFLGNSGITQPGRRVPDDGLVAVLSATPHKAKAGSSWLGSPPVRLRRKPTAADALRTFHPSVRLKILRALVETCRLIPMMVTFAIGVAVLVAVQWLAVEVRLGMDRAGRRRGAAGRGRTRRRHRGDREMACGRPNSGRSSIRYGRRSCGATRCRIRSSRRWPAPWFARAASGTPVMNLWLRALGAKIGRGVWCETYWLPEADLVTLERAATVNRGCVVQTHLFHDRIMRMDTVVLEEGATLGPHCVALPAARARRRRHRRPGVAGDARRRGAGVDPLARQSDRAVEPVPQEARRCA